MYKMLGGPLDGQIYEGELFSNTPFIVLDLNDYGMGIDIYSMYEYFPETNSLSYVSSKSKQTILDEYSK